MNDNQRIVSEDVLASKGQRFANYLIDLIPHYIISYGIAYGFFYIGEFTGNYTLNDYWNNMSLFEDYLYGYLIFFLYYFLFENFTSRSLGKYVTNTRVVTVYGENPTIDVFLKRTLCRLIPFEAFSFLGTNGKGWHDAISKTYVVDNKKFDAKVTMELELEQIGKQAQDL